MKFLNPKSPLSYSILFSFLALCLFSCANNETDRKALNSIYDKPDYPYFWGDSTLTIISSNRPNDYLVKIFKSKDLSLLNLSRGDSINVYIPITKIPGKIFSEGYITDSPGTYIRKFDIPIVEAEDLDTCWDWFFMDGDFDGKEEFVIEHPGYNRRYFAFFNLEKGDTSTMPGLLMPNNNPPFNNIVSGEDSYTKFDRKKKTIHIFEQLGCCEYTETWAEMTKDYDGENLHLEVVRKENVKFGQNSKITTIYYRIDGELKEIEKRKDSY